MWKAEKDLCPPLEGFVGQSRQPSQGVEDMSVIHWIAAVFYILQEAG